MFFYAYWKLEYLPILLGSIVANYFFALQIIQPITINTHRGGAQYNKLTLYFIRSIPTFYKFLLSKLSPRFYLVLGILFNLCLLGFFKYTDFFLENFNALSQLLHLDFNIPLPHILLPLALSFVTFQQIAFLVDCYKHTKSLESQIPLESYRDSNNLAHATLNSQTNLDSNSTNSQLPLESYRESQSKKSQTLDSPNIRESQHSQTTLDSKESLDVQSLDSQSSLESSSMESKGSTTQNPKNTQIQERDSTHSLTHINFLDYCLFITFFPQLIAGPIVHHGEMMPQFARLKAYKQCKKHKKHKKDNEHTESHTTLSHTLSQFKEYKSPQCQETQTLLTSENVITTAHSNTTDTRMYEVSQAQETYRESQKHNRDSKESLVSQNISESQHSQTTLDSKTNLDLQSLESKANLDSQHSQSNLESQTLESYRDSNNLTHATLDSQSLNSQNPQTLDSKATLDSKTTLDSQHSQSTLESKETLVSHTNNKSHIHLANRAFIHWELVAKGLFIFSLGLFKKVFIADSFAKWANAGYSVVEKGGSLNIFESWITSLSYTFQLYFDFSGYCDMAIGLGLLFGIMLPINFNSPYKALNIADFWRRWHITLGRFLKEYLYIPLGGNRNDKRNPSLAQSLHTHNSPHLSMSDSSYLTHHSYANKTPNSYTLDNGMNIGDSNHRDSHTTESHLIQSQAKRDSKDSQTLLESQDSLNIENNTESFNSHNNVESTDSQSHFNSHNVFNPEAKKEPLESTQKDSHNTIQSVESKNRNSHTTDSKTHKESQINTESYVSQTIKQSVDSQNTQYNVSRHSEGARATEESTQSESIKKESKQKDSKQSESIKSNESIGSESKQREYKNVLESQINTESIDSHTSFISQSHFDSQTILESQRDSKEKEEVTQRVSQTNTESKVSHTSLHNTLCNKLLTLRNLFIVAFLSGIWHGAGWGFVIWGIMHGIAMCVHRIYMWWCERLQAKIDSLLVESSNVDSTPDAIDSRKHNITKGFYGRFYNTTKLQTTNSTTPHTKIPYKHHFARIYLAFMQTKLYKALCWFLTFNFVNIAWIFFRAENIQGACNLLKGMFGGTYIALPNFLENTLAFLKTRGVVFEKWLENVQADFMVLLWIFGVLLLCLWFRNSVEMLRCFTPKIRNLAFGTLLFYAALFMLGEHAATEFLYFNF